MAILDGKIALVTGAGRGIALALAREGAAVAVIDIDGSSAATVADAIVGFGGQALAVQTDIRVTKQVNESVKATGDRFEGVDVLVNNAISAVTQVPFEQIDDESIELAFATGPVAVPRYLRATHPYLATALSAMSIRRTGDPEADMGRTAVFLAGPDSSYITGCTISVDGGGSFVG